MTNSWKQWLTSFSRALSATFALLLLVACAHRSTVVRVRGESSQLGREIPAAAYALFIIALRNEAQGNLDDAESLFLSALKVDPASGASWAGAVRTGCRISAAHVEELTDSAIKAADRPALALLALAECLTHPIYPEANEDRGRLGRATTAARQALRYEPLLAGATLALGESLILEGDPRAGARAFRAYELYTQLSLPASTAAELDQDKFFESAEVDSLLAADQITAAIDASAGVFTAGELSLRMLALGKQNDALSLARHTLSNDVQDPDAQLAVCLSQRPFVASDVMKLYVDPNEPQLEISPLGWALVALELAQIDKSASDVLVTRLAHSSEAESDPLVQWWLTTLRENER